jgi:hypothetical protein
VLAERYKEWSLIITINTAQCDQFSVITGGQISVDTPSPPWSPKILYHHLHLTSTPPAVVAPRPPVDEYPLQDSEFSGDDFGDCASGTMDSSEVKCFLHAKHMQNKTAYLLIWCKTRAERVLR